MLIHWLSQEFFSFFIIFCRIGSFFIYMPTIGETYIKKNIRLLFAFSFSIFLQPILKHIIPNMPITIILFSKIVIIEILIGVFIGIILRIYLQSLTVAGSIISYHIGFSSASLLNPLFAEQGSVLSALLIMTGILMIYATNLHDSMFIAAVYSYKVFPIGQMPISGDMANLLTHVVGQSFLIGVHLATPFIVTIISFYIVLGILSKLAPQIQIFFISMPAQIIIGMLVFSLTISSIMLYFISQYSNILTNILPGNNV